MQKKALTKEKIKVVLKNLHDLYAGAESELDFNSPFQLLIATILAAQCTDKRVNQVTSKLFKAYDSPEDFLKLTEEELGNWIHSCGFYRSKSKNILATCRILVDRYNGEVPEEREQLMELPGVGRKTANVVISNVFDKDAIAVDTHVFRVSNRLGLANADDVLKTEEQLMKNIPQNLWSEAHHWLIYHGRRVCKARKPLCGKCLLSNECLYYRENNKV
ncbi:endonuclease III [Alkaliphilus peptidifermentans]|uniref:Endonuclease III n=1 Tax=Alkaliphilus peptidifermentans DSM 18978 TaxID=1120976 RepID=A0A1G5K3M5_9FIRM|nr:endonuclease III [Alkaliphilus peptidifermentans]SCY94821.1 DNA-(apurinic or apyrimidinic site) lyase /endonuclease III [Alkaliphilus peptidifermentans DSM 18978]